MQKGVYENLKPPLQLLLAFVTVGVSMIVTVLLWFFILMIFKGEDYYTMLSLTANDADFLRNSQIVQSFAVFIFPPLIVAFLVSKNVFKWLCFDKPKMILILLALILIFICQPMISFLVEMNHSIEFPQFLKSFEYKMRLQESETNNLLFKILDTKQPFIILLNVFMVVILAAFGEEMLFRGTLQPLFGKVFKNDHAAVWVTAFLFSFIHFQFMTFIPRFILGALFGYIFLYGKNIWYPIVAHFLNNLMSLVVFYYYRYTQPDINPMELQDNEFGTLMIIGSFLAVGAIGWLFYKFRIK